MTSRLTALIAFFVLAASGQPWSAGKAWRWYRGIQPIRGFNYLPRTAVNSTEMWQAETFDAATIDQELGWAAGFGYNGMRVFLPYLVWKQDPAGFKARLDELLRIAGKHGIRAMLVLFDDCNFAGKEPYPGKQDDPIPGRHNSGWVASPGRKLVADRSAWPDLERYVKDVVGRFRKDRRVQIWDLYNEPGASKAEDESLPLLESAFQWAREAGPTQPLTVGVWKTYEKENQLTGRMLALSDIHTFHNYGTPKIMELSLALCRDSRRPCICTEWMAREVGSTFAAILPQFAAHDIGWYHWGLVAGRTQTYYWWGSKKGAPPPQLWQHDVLHPDGNPFDAAEMELVRHFSFKIPARPAR